MAEFAPWVQPDTADQPVVLLLWVIIVGHGLVLVLGR
jgi:hypothetical protein